MITIKIIVKKVIMKISKLNKHTVLKGGIILDPINNIEKKGDLYIKDGKINSLFKIDHPKEANVIDCEGLVVTHGFMDMHVHFREPGREDKETLNSGSMAA